MYVKLSEEKKITPKHIVILIITFILTIAGWGAATLTLLDIIGVVHLS